MFFSVKELLGLPGMPGTLPGLRAAMNKRAGDSVELVRKREGSKAMEYHISCLPQDVQEVMRKRHYSSLLTSEGCALDKAISKPQKSARQSQELALMRQCPALLDREVSELTDRQKLVADARALLASEVERMRDAGVSRASAVRYIAEGSRSGSLPASLNSATELANARKGSTRVGISERALQEWVTIFQTTRPGVERQVLLAPGHLKARKPEQIRWLPAFLNHWRCLKGPSMQAAYDLFRREWERSYCDQPAMARSCPSLDTVRRAMKKLPRRELAKGRVSGSAALAFQTYQKRDWSLMPVNGCWIADGKSLDMKVAHPVHGRPFTPELTLVIDGRTRVVVGWSLALSENVIAVADAYRHGMKHYGKPLYVYSDNGGGETNKILDADVTGIFPRMGIEHPTSIPGRPQSRGIIERLNAVVPRAIALNFDTYNGHGADRENVRMTGRAISSAVNAVEKGYDLTPAQRRSLTRLPSWQQLIDTIEAEVHKYNEHHEHSELPKKNGRHMTPAAYRREVLASEGDDIEYLTDIELREMFMPEMVRTAQRGWIELMNNQYFSEDLINVDGEQVRVSFDIHDPSEVLIRRIDGTFVCKAIWNGNKRAAIPVSHMDRAVEQRRQRRLKRVEDQRRDIEDEARQLVDGSTYPDFGAFIPAEYSATTENEHYFFLAADRDEYIKKSGTNQ
ncbi:transposase [Erwinia aphidicola]|nr:transposase [Erwinia aphidicola]